MISKDKKSEVVGDLLGVVLFGLLFLGLALWIRLGETHLYIQTVRQWALMMAHDPSIWHRLAGFTGFVLAGGLLISLGLPRIWFSAASGAVFGLGWGIVAAMLASILGASALFWMGSAFLSAMARRRAGGKLASWRSGLQSNAFWWVLYLRLFPFSNATLASLICGSCHIGFAPFTYASLIGFLPYTVVFAAFGNAGFHGNPFQILIGFALLGATIMLRKWLNHYQTKTSLASDL
jgi:uncharacterized membrane protein YdjX (TVP38/TMEM64 family)